MQTGLQSPDIVHNIERLIPADASIELPEVDPSILTPTLPIESGWVNMQPYIMQDGSIDLNGVTASRVDAGAGVATVATTLFNTAPTQTDQRFYQTISVELTGGTVSPIMIFVNLRVQNVATNYTRIDCANPGSLVINSVYVPAGMILQVGTAENGGAGDLLHLGWSGISCPSGVRIAATPAPTTLTHT